MGNDIMVSIRCMAFNHEPYIRQCLDSLVSQKTNFKYEIVVHDDASTDATPEIIHEYELKYPHIIKPIYQKENQYSQGADILTKFIFPKIRGKYLAVCEGDDYWCDENKLQKQFDFMEAHKECAICVHEVEAFRDNTGEVAYLIPDMKKKETAVISSRKFFRLLGDGMNIFPVVSHFVRTDVLKKYITNIPEFRKVCSVGDIPLSLFYASQGDLGYISEIMARYRIASQGSWTSKNNADKARFLKTHMSICECYKKFDEYTNGEYKESLQKLIFDRAEMVYYCAYLFGKNGEDIKKYTDILSFKKKTEIKIKNAKTKLKITLKNLKEKSKID